MNDWWEMLTTFQKFYWFITVPATTFMLLQTIMTGLGAGGDGDVDSDFDLDTDFDGDMDLDADIDIDGDFEVDMNEGFQISMGIFSIRNLVAFFTFFGWTGILLSGNNMNNYLVILLSVIAGIIAMMLSFSLFYFMQKMTSNGAIKHKSAIGRIGTVYIPIPSKRSGIGKVTLNIQGGSNELEAMTDDEEVINTNAVVKVESIIDNRILLVKKVENKE